MIVKMTMVCKIFTWTIEIRNSWIYWKIVIIKRLDELLHLSLSYFIMSKQILIQFLDGTEFTYTYTEEPISYNWIIEFEWKPHIGSYNVDEKWNRKVTMHLSNIAFYRTFKDVAWPDYTNDLEVHYKDNTCRTMMKWEINIMWDFLHVDTHYDHTFIPLRNIKYYEVF